MFTEKKMNQDLGFAYEFRGGLEVWGFLTVGSPSPPFGGTDSNL